MLWLDGLLSVPAIGILLKPNFKNIFLFQERLVAFIDLISKEYDELVINKLEEWGYSIKTPKSGFSFKLSPRNIIVEFSYVLEEKLQAGAFPAYDIPELSSYSELLEKTKKYIQELVHGLKDIEGFEYRRVGIVAETDLDKESPPPGISAFLNHLGKPWKGPLTISETKLVAELNKGDNYIDRCHHLLSFNEEVPGMGYRLKLDWQRLFKEPVPLEPAKLQRAIDDCITKAKGYFETFGEGDLNYD